MMIFCMFGISKLKTISSLSEQGFDVVWQQIRKLMWMTFLVLPFFYKKKILDVYLDTMSSFYK